MLHFLLLLIFTHLWFKYFAILSWPFFNHTIVFSISSALWKFSAFIKMFYPNYYHHSFTWLSTWLRWLVEYVDRFFTWWSNVSSLQTILSFINSQKQNLSSYLSIFLSSYLPRQISIDIGLHTLSLVEDDSLSSVMKTFDWHYAVISVLVILFVVSLVVLIYIRSHSPVPDKIEDNVSEYSITILIFMSFHQMFLLSIIPRFQL
jgi:hypothetical protein